MQIYVVSAAAKQFTLEIENSSSTIENVKKVIKNREEGKELPMDELDLVFQGTILEEGKTLSYYNIQDGSTLGMDFQLRGETVQVFFEREELQTYRMEIGKSDTLDDLKKKIEDLNGISPDWEEQEFNGTCLKEGVILDQMRLIQSKVHGRPTIISQYPLGRMENQLRRMEYQLPSLLGETVEVSVQDEVKGWTWRIKIGESDTLDDLKKKVEDVIGRYPDWDTHNFNGEHLKEEGVILDQMRLIQRKVLESGDQERIDAMYDFHGRPTIMMYKLPNKVRMENMVHHGVKCAEGSSNPPKRSSPAIKIDDASDDNVMDSNDASDDNGKGGIESMQFYGLNHWITLEIENSSSTIENVKNVIKNKEQGKELPMDELDLVFHGTILEEGKTLSYSNDQHGSTLDMVFQLRGETVHFILKREQLRTYRVEIGESDTLDDLKKKIGDVIGIYPHGLMLNFNGTWFEEGVILDQMRLIQSKVLGSGDRERIDASDDNVMDSNDARDDNDDASDDNVMDSNDASDDNDDASDDNVMDSNDASDDKDDASDDNVMDSNDANFGNGGETIQVFLIRVELRTYRMEIGESDTLDDLKKKIEDVIGIYRHWRVLNFNGTWLKEGVILGQMRLIQSKVLESGDRERITGMFFNNGRPTIISENPLYRTEDYLQPLIGETVQVIVEDDREGWTIRIEIGESDTLHDLKKKIEDVIGIYPNWDTHIFNGGYLNGEGVILDQMRLIQRKVLERIHAIYEKCNVGMYKDNGRRKVLERMHAIYEEHNAGMYKDNGRRPTIKTMKMCKTNIVHHSPKWADGSSSPPKKSTTPIKIDNTNDDNVMNSNDHASRPSGSSSMSQHVSSEKGKGLSFDEEFNSKLNLLAEVNNKLANSLNGNDWDRLTSSLRVVPNISSKKFFDAVDLFEQKPTLICIFLSLNPQEKEVWLVRKLGY